MDEAVVGKTIFRSQTLCEVVLLWGAVPMVFGIGKCASVCMCGMCIFK
jgi:hypothetical protein